MINVLQLVVFDETQYELEFFANVGQWKWVNGGLNVICWNYKEYVKNSDVDSELGLGWLYIKRERWVGPG